jgi:diguanylate cyclase (GGDEF)-like protein
VKVLVVGDKAHERDIVVQVLTELGHGSVEAKDGEEGWQAYQEQDFDIIISDFIMPKMNGLELCRAVRGQPKDHYTYILVASLFSEKQHILAGFEAGVDDYASKPLDLDELRVRLISAVRVTEVHFQLASKNKELAELGRNLLAESRRDPLTNVGNRLRFQDDVTRLMDEIKRYGHRFCLGMCDIDNFKLYNDTYGHLAGDQVLKKVAQTLATKSRASDHVYRMGGEEFLVILSDQDEASAAIAAERLRAQVEALDILHERNHPFGKVTLTIGLAPFWATTGGEIDRDLQAADRLLYQGKFAGRNQVVSSLTPAESANSAS